MVRDAVSDEAAADLLAPTPAFHFVKAAKDAQSDGTKRLLKESTVKWTQEYPKTVDCKWWKDAGEGSRESRERPMFEGTGQFRHPAPSSTAIPESAPAGGAGAEKGGM